MSFLIGEIGEVEDGGELGGFDVEDFVELGEEHGGEEA